jgi:hypothetical protein
LDEEPRNIVIVYNNERPDCPPVMFAERGFTLASRTAGIAVYRSS